MFNCQEILDKYSLMKIVPNSIKQCPLIGIFLIIASGLCISWTASPPDSRPCFYPECLPLGALPVVTFLLSFGLLWMLYQFSQAFLPIRVLSPRKSRPCQVLILLLTKPNLAWKQTKQEDKIVLDFEGKSQHTLEGGAKQLESGIKSLDNLRWNWQQLLRSLTPHVGSPKLKRIILVGSIGGDQGSEGSLDRAIDLIQNYVADTVCVEKSPDVNDFEDFVYLRDQLQMISTQLLDEGIPAEDILIDVTGGQKTASIAGAITALTNRSRIQYVTNNGVVLAYDMVLQVPPKGN